MSILLEKQQEFGMMVPMLLWYALLHGYKYTLGHAYRCPNCYTGHPRSLHKLRLAIDINLFKDGIYLTKTEDYAKLGEFWESIGGTWGGRFGDGNHFSLAYEGMK